MHHDVHVSSWTPAQADLAEVLLLSKAEPKRHVTSYNHAAQWLSPQGTVVRTPVKGFLRRPNKLILSLWLCLTDVCSYLMCDYVSTDPLNLFLRSKGKECHLGVGLTPPGAGNSGREWTTHVAESWDHQQSFCT